MALAVLLGAASAAPTFGQTACEDRDLDGYFAVDDCGSPRDCNDDDALIFPGAQELCDGRDSDCDAFVDNGPACDRSCDNPELMPGSTQVTSDPNHWSQWGNVVWVGDGWIVAYESLVSEYCMKVSLQRLDVAGNPVGEPVTVSGGDGVLASAREPWLAWTGRELIVAWSESATTSDCLTQGVFRVYFQRYAPDLHPLGARVRLGCAQSESEAEPRPVWAGHQYGIAWARGQEGLRFTALSRDGQPADSCGVVVASSNHSGSSPDGHALTWNGTHFGLSWSDARPDADFINIFSDIYFRRIAEDMSLPEPSPIQVTDEPKRSEWTSSAWADGEWGVSWADERTNSWNLNEIFLARLHATGNKVDPPGDIQITCCSTEVTDPPRFWNKLKWTGEEFGIAYVEENHPWDTTGDVFIQRVDRLGTKLGGPVLITPDSAQRARHVDMDWNGKEYGIVWDDDKNQTGQATRQVWFARIGCNCVDADSDTFSTCAGGDCNDSDPLVNPAQQEACLDGVDNNCDAQADCQDTTNCPAQGGPVPSEIQGVLFSADKQSLSWQPERRSDVYDLLTGDLRDLRSAGDFSRSRCLAWRIPATSYADTTVPAGGAGLYYLVRGKADRCKLGTWGSALRDQAKLTCP